MHSTYYKIEEMLENYKKQLPEPRADWPHDMKRAVAFIIAHLFDPKLTVSWLRKKCRITGKSFSGIFRTCTGYYPKEYILHHRIEAGKLLLKQTEATITEIALALGFSSLSAFCNTFKNKQGVQPTKWRKQNQN